MGTTLLLADDSITIQRVIELTFADEDIRVVVAGDGQQAIQKIDSEHPDIVLADVGMPRLDGYAVASHVKQSAALRHIPVLLLTGAFEPIDEARARQTGCDGVLVKPFEPHKLVAQVKELLAGTRGNALWPADMPRAQVEQVRPVEQVPVPVPVQQPAPVVPVIIEETPAARTMPELLRAQQQEVAAPPLSVPAVDPDFDIDPIIDPVFDLSTAQLAPGPAAESLEGEDVPNRDDSLPRHTRPDLPPPSDHFESELDMLDAALSRLDPTAHPHELDPATASEFARDLNEMRNESNDARADETNERPSPPSFGSWDLPKPSHGEPIDRRPIDVVAEEIPLRPAPRTTPAPALPAVSAPPVVQVSAPVIHVPAPVVQEPAPVVQAPAPAIQVPIASPSPIHPAPAAQAAPIAPVAPVLTERPTLSSAFSALLAAEKSRPAAHAAAPQISEAAIEEVVKRVLARMAGDTVNRVVLETAERLIREEISRTKDPSGR